MKAVSFGAECHDTLQFMKFGWTVGYVFLKDGHNSDCWKQENNPYYQLCVLFIVRIYKVSYIMFPVYHLFPPGS